MIKWDSSLEGFKGALQHRSPALGEHLAARGAGSVRGDGARGWGGATTRRRLWPPLSGSAIAGRLPAHPPARAVPARGRAASPTARLPHARA